MRVKLPYFIMGLLALSSFALRAQDYQQMSIASGLNADVIANGTGTVVSSTTIDIDGVNYNYVATDYKLTPTSTPITYGVPVNGLINSIAAATPGLSFQLASLSANNSLRLPTAAPTGELIFTTPVAVTKLYMLAVTGSGAGTVTAVVTFTDNTTQTFTGLSVPDWYGGTNPAPAILGIGRINRTTNGLEPNVNDPRMYQVPMTINIANQAKLVQKVQITKTSTGGGVVNVFAFTAEVTPTCPSPPTLTATSTATSGTVNWTVPPTIPALGYDYYISTSSTTPAPTQTPTGNTANTTISFPGLPTGVQHYVWIRSNCSSTDKGVWKMATFTTGLLSITYTAGDISTPLNETPTTTSTTECPGFLTVNVPAGYQIASTAVSYTMTAQGGAWMSEQRTFMRCVNTGLAESQVYNGTGNAGTMSYNRTGLTIANGAAGAVQFELRAWRAWPLTSVDCNTTYNKVNNNSWVITVTYAPIPCTTPLAAPTAANQVACAGSTVADLDATGVPGAIFSWFTTSTGGTALATTAPVTAGTYYVSQGYGGVACESPRTQIAVTINTIPAPSAAPVTACAGATVAEIQPTGLPGAIFKCYTALTGGTQVEPTSVLVNGSYYVSQTVDGCESTRTQVTVTLTVVPPPTATAQAVCPNTTLNNIVVTATGTKKWYAAATGGTELNSGTFVTAATYYVSQTVGGCESLRTAVAITLNATPTPGATSQALCPGATVADLTATAATGATINWYASGAIGTPLTATTELATGSYFVSQTLNGCESGLLQVAITINTIPLPTATETQSLCADATVADLTATPIPGATLHWYEDATGGTGLTPATALTTGSYFVSQSIGACESGRKEIAVNLNATSGPAAVAQTHCPGSTVADLEATGGEGATLNWYEDATGGTALAETVEITTGSYFVSQSINGCESVRTEVAVSINVLAVPATNDEQTVCPGSTINNLYAIPIEDAVINWYENLADTTPLTNTAVLTSGSYFVSQTKNGCESARVEVALTVGLPAMPATETTQTFCAGAKVEDLIVDAEDGAIVNWYFTNTNGQPLNPQAELVSGVYFATQIINGCESLGNDSNIVINPVIPEPSGNSPQQFTPGDTVDSLLIGILVGADVNWYVMVEGELVAIDTTEELQDGVTYYVTQTLNGCESTPHAIIAQSEIVGIDAFDATTVRVYPNPVQNILTVTTANETISDIIIVNMLGQKVLSQKANANTLDINVSELSAGNYFLQVFCESGKTMSSKIIKQ